MGKKTNKKRQELWLKINDLQMKLEFFNKKFILFNNIIINIGDDYGL